MRYDFSQWRPLLAYRSGVVVYTSDGMGVNNIEEFLAMPDRHLVMASMGPTSDDLFVLMAFELLNINISSIFGSPGRGSARKIFMRGEANMDFKLRLAIWRMSSRTKIMVRLCRFLLLDRLMIR